MNKKFIHILPMIVLISLVTMAIPTLPMDLPQKTNIWQSFKQFLKSERAITPVCYILFIGHTAKEIFKFFNHEIHTDIAYWDNQKNASDLVCNFIRTTLQENGVPQETIDTISIKNNEDWKAAYHHICVPNDGIQTLLTTTSTDEYPLTTKISYVNWHVANYESLEWPINTCKNYVLHEYGHILNKDSLKFVIAPIITPIIAYSLLGIPYQAINFSFSIKSFPIQALIHIARLYMSLKIAPILTIGYKKYREHEADKVAMQLCKDTTILEDAGKLYKLYHEQDTFPEITDPICQKWYLNNIIFRELYHWWKRPTDPHLSALTRKEYFTHAAELLNSKQSMHNKE